MRVLWFKGSLPTRALVPHLKASHAHHAAVKRMRNEFHILGVGQRVQSEPMKRFNLVYEYCPPNREFRKREALLPKYRRSYAPTDHDNAFAAAKPAIDGLRDAGILADDDHKHVVSSVFRRRDPDENSPAGYLLIGVIEVGEEENP